MLPTENKKKLCTCQPEVNIHIFHTYRSPTSKTQEVFLLQ